MASYRKRHIKSRVHKIKPKKSIFKRLWFWIFLLFLLIVLSIFYFFLFYSGIQIKNIIISGNEKVASKDIENLISDDINNKILSIGNWEVDSKSIFLINSDKLDREILNKFPIIESVKIDKRFMQTLEIKISERKPVGIFCGNNEECFMIDQNGVIFEPIANTQELDILRLSQGECCKMFIMRQMLENGDLFAGENIIAQNIMGLLLKVKKT